MFRPAAHVVLVLFAALLPATISALDPLPPDAEAIMNPEPLPAGDPVEVPEDMPTFDELTGVDGARPPISFQTGAKPASVTEVGDLPPTPPASEELSPAAVPAQEDRPDFPVTSAEAGERGHSANPDAGGDDMLFLVLAAGLGMLLPAGFLLMQAGLGRARNVGHTSMVGFVAFIAAVAGFWMTGFAVQMGGAGEGRTGAAGFSVETREVLDTLISVNIAGADRGIAGGGIFFLGEGNVPAEVHALFLFHAVLAGLAAVLVAGVFMERGRFFAATGVSFAVGSVIYPLVGCWVWGGGWLTGFGLSDVPGHGHVDVSGSTVLHLCAGILGIVGLKMLGPRAGVFNGDGTVNAIPGHNLNLVATGVLLVSVGWIGLVLGTALPELREAVPRMATNTLLGAVGGAAGALCVTEVIWRRRAPVTVLQGWVGGLVACSAGSAFYEPWAAVLIGTIAGLFSAGAAHAVLRGLKLDDPAGLIATHGVCGVWGGLAVGVFAGAPGQIGWNGVEAPVSGLLGGNAVQLGVQAVGTTAIGVAVFLMGVAVFGLLKAGGRLRVSAESEFLGLDRAELQTLGYQPDITPEAEDLEK